MDDPTEDVRPNYGDIVRPKGWKRDMLVVNGELGNFFEGIYNGVLVRWTDEAGEHEEVFSHVGMTIVKRADPNDPLLTPE